MKVDLKCKECGSPNTYTTLSERVCRRCGHRSKIKHKENPKDAKEKHLKGVNINGSN